MDLTITKSASNTKGEVSAIKVGQPQQDFKKCKYCDYEHWDDFNLRFHEEMHKEYCEEKQVKRQKKRREYELMLIRRFNLKKEILSLQRNFAANELNIKDYETDEETKESACEVRERVWENRAGKNWYSDTSFADEHLELGYYVLTQHERELAAEALGNTESVMEGNFHRLSKLGATPTQNATL
ncbi:MAG: hypothetical protein M3270_08315 [Thermoproteota archaeon]|nr:hypothetical protein [Thermoproteota archaeon]